MNVVKLSRILSRGSGKPTKPIRVIRDSTNHVLAAQKHGVKIGWLTSRELNRVKSRHMLKYASSVRNMDTPQMSKNEQRCMRCSGQHTVKQCTEPKKSQVC